tara:strand:+ start:104 stop:262 length:159 start_codon:yes stop_codon:yes gene_type:complete
VESYADGNRMHLFLIVVVVYIALLVMMPDQVVSLTVLAGAAAWEVLSRLLLL